MKKMDLSPVPTKKQTGFTLVESLLVIGILAIVVSAIVAVASSTSASQTAQSEARTIDAAGIKLKSIYSSRPNYGGLTTVVAQDLEVWPDSMGDPARNAWGGAVTVATPPNIPKGAGDANRQFEINWTAIGEDACSDLASAQTSAIGVDVDGVEVYDRGQRDLDVGRIAANCADGVTITFVYGKT